MYSNNDLSRFSPSHCGEQGYAVIGGGGEIEGFCKAMLGAGAGIVAVGWEPERLRELEALTSGSGGTLSGLPLPAPPDKFEDVTAALERMEVYLEGVVVGAGALLGRGAASELFSLRDAESKLVELGRALAQYASVYTNALVVFGERYAQPPGSPVRLRALAEALTNAISSGFADGGASVRANALLAGDSEVPGAMYHLLYESFLDRAVVRVEGGFLVPV